MSEVSLSVAGGVAHVTLNRPERRNALDRASIEALTAILQRCAGDDAVRVVQISGAGKMFCAGADLVEMQAQAGASELQNLAHAELLSKMLGVLDNLPKPTLARVNGDAYGGALGIIGACDLAVVVDSAQFAFTEVRLGLIPAVISPFVLAKMGESAALRYFLSAEPFGATELVSARLAHEIVCEARLDEACAGWHASLLKGAPRAQAEAKSLIREVLRDPRERAQISLGLAERLARLRVQPEAQEGLAAFFAKRTPSWRLD